MPAAAARASFSSSFFSVLGITSVLSSCAWFMGSVLPEWGGRSSKTEKPVKSNLELWGLVALGSFAVCRAAVASFAAVDAAVASFAAVDATAASFAAVDAVGATACEIPPGVPDSRLQPHSSQNFALSLFSE